MAAPTEIIVDQHAPLSHKEIVGTATSAAGPGLRVAPGWCPRSERRRIAAYLVRHAYWGNVARLVLRHNLPAGERAGHAEYGDPGLLIDRHVAGVLGQEWTLNVDGADDDLPDDPDRPPDVDPLPADADPLTRRIHAAKTARRAIEAETAVDEWEAAWAAQPALRARQTEVREWADRVGLGSIVDRWEHACVALGDTVVVLWPQTGGWPLPEVIDPGGYFPVLAEHDDGTYPNKVHLAWEYTVDQPGPNGTVTEVRRLRRITFELVDLTGLRVTTTRLGRTVWAGPDGRPADQPALAASEGVDDTGRVYRLYPWAYDDATDQGAGRFDAGTDLEDRRSHRTCIVSDGTWDLDRVRAGDIGALDDSHATWRTLDDGRVMRRMDMGVDFLPVVHIPNTAAGREHFGASVLDSVAQILDDVADVDTSIIAASRYLGHPVIHAPGVTAGELVVPGTMIGGPEGSRMDVLDLSAGLEKLMGLAGILGDRLWQNARMPKPMIGRLQGDTEASGVSLALQMAPFAQVVGSLRMVRDPKWRLILKMAQRLAQAQGALPPGVTPTARLVPGSFLPTNRAETMTKVAQAVQGHVMSLQTAVTMLVAAGVPVDDARAEVDRIVAEDVEAANAVADALAGAPEALEVVAARLGVELAEPTVPPIRLPDPAS